jgi:ABC-type taurine transport system substrate-binding protein
MKQTTQRKRPMIPSPKPLSPDQQRYYNANHANWLKDPSTIDFMERLQGWAKMPAPAFYTAESVLAYQANAIIKGAYQEILDIMQNPPFPDVENEAAQQELDLEGE